MLVLVFLVFSLPVLMSNAHTRKQRACNPSTQMGALVGSFAQYCGIQEGEKEKRS
jgi:hypothetical protein